MSAPPRYAPRESVPMFGLVIAALVIIPAASLLAAIYALVTFYVPFVSYVSVLAAPALGLGVGFVVEQALRAAKIRSKTYGLALAVFGGVVAWYANWVVWLAALANDPSFALVAVRPLAFIEILIEINATGAWEIDNYQPRGLVLLLLWAFEAALIIGVATKVGREHAESLYMRPFCEQCRSWEAPTQTLACLELGADDPEDLRAAIAAGNWEPLLGRGHSEDEDQAVRLVGGSCKCGELNLLSIEHHTHDSDDYRYETLGRDLLVDERLVSRLCQGNRAAR